MVGTKYDLSIKIASDEDITKSRRVIKDLASEFGFRLTDTTKIATAVSELARNIVRYAKEGYINVTFGKDKLRGDFIEIIADDKGPGIEDVEKFLEAGTTTTQKSLGLGLSAVKRLMDEMEIETEMGKGTKITTKKYKK